MNIVDRGDDVVWTLRVRGLGVVMLRGSGAAWHGVSIFTEDELQFD